MVSVEVWFTRPDGAAMDADLDALYMYQLFQRKYFLHIG